MKFQTRLTTAFGTVAGITLGISLLGFWQASQLGSALYEVGVVRLPSIVGLNLIWRAKADLDASERVLATPGADAATVARERKHRREAQRHGSMGWEMYEPLPQTPKEALEWKAFIPAWREWKASYDSVIAYREASVARPAGFEASSANLPQSLAARSARVDTLLAKLYIINNQIANAAKAQSVASYQDLELMRKVMLLAAIASVLGAIGLGLMFARRLSRPMVEADEEQQRTQQALKKSEEKFFKVFKSAPVGISVSKVATREILEVNDQFLKLLGYTRDEVVGRSATDLGVWADEAARERMMSRVRQDGVAYSEAQLVSKTGEIKTVRGAVHTLELDGEMILVSAVADVTEQRRAQTELIRSEHQYRMLVDGVRDVIVAMTPEGNLTALNRAFEDVTGWRRDQWIGQSFLGLLVPEDAAKAFTLFQAVLDERPRPITLLRIRTADGKVRIAETYLDAHREDGKVVGVLGIARDVTDRVQLEEEYRHAQKMEAVGQLAGGIAHDFNNLLTVIRGYSGVLLEEMDPADPLRADVEEISNAGVTASSLTRQLLAFSRRQVLQPKVMNMNDVVSSAVNLVDRLIGEDVHLITSLSDNTGNVRTDAGQLEQTIMNLAVNARDAMPNGGTLTIVTESLVLGEERLRGHPDATPGNYVMLAVSDSGIGMDDSTKARIFEPFFTTKEIGKGTGLGLATVFGIVKQSKGFIRVISAPRKGSTFEIYLPEIHESADVTVHVTSESDRGTETVLVVEDEDAVRGVVRQILERRGYTVLEASSGQAALHLARDHQGEIDLLLTDVVMLGMGGGEVSRRLTEDRPGICTVFMSGYTDDRVIEQDVFDGCSTFVQKPFSPSDLARTVREVLDARTTAPAIIPTVLSTA